MGEQALKNLQQPVLAWRWPAETRASAPRAASSGPALPDKPSVAVLPFTNMSGDPGQEHICDGISEDIITALSKLSKLFVVSRNSTFTYKGRPIDIKLVGREQGVRYVLEGSVRRAGDRLRITAQLIDAVSGHHLWAERYDRPMQDVFALQDEITREVTASLQVELTEGDRARLWASGTKNLEAWETVIQVPELLESHRRADVLPARRLAQRALQIDEGYAAAWAMLGWSHWNEAFDGWAEDAAKSLQLALDALMRAQAIDAGNPDTLALLTFVHLSLRDYDKAWSFAEKAMLAGPNHSFAHAVAANVALFTNRPQEMIPLLQKAMRLCPISPAWYFGDLGYAHLLLGHHDKAIEAAETAIRLDPEYIYAFHVLAVAGAELDKLDVARKAAEHILRIDPKFTITAYAGSQPFQDPALQERLGIGFRKAGLPE